VRTCTAGGFGTADAAVVATGYGGGVGGLIGAGVYAVDGCAFVGGEEVVALGVG